ncbi:DMT family transporter [Psychrobacter sp. 16-MNA-CIBAN-0192]|uniref:DMT family transporter n=1 Tax=Psychrobacter sp. 16-MNA-CIBAN-0192 TaxID=3140448 RepID=UPI003333ABDC
MKKITQGWISGFIGVVIFAGSLPATRLAIMGFDPVFLTAARAILAALLGGAVLLLLKQRMPTKADFPALAIVTLGVVIGFPLLSALALQYVTSAHAIVFLGILPLFTAIFAVWRGSERPSALFWLFALLGSFFVAGYAALSSGHTSLVGGLLMMGAVVACALGYAEGGRLSRVLGGWQVISWALVLSLPIMLPIAWLTWPKSLVGISITAWAGLIYVSLFSMFIGFVFWYRGLALGGIAAVGQLQLMQPFLGLTLAAILLHETVSIGMLISTLGAVACMVGAKKFAV